MVDKEVFELVSWGDLQEGDQELYVLEGEAAARTQVEARFVAGGHMQDRSVYSADETSSTTVSNSALYIVATIVAHEGRKVRIMDIGSAYLNAEIKREVLMVIQPSLTKILCSIAPGYSKFIREDGYAVVKLLRPCTKRSCIQSCTG
jgi:hypothetical protein